MIADFPGPGTAAVGGPEVAVQRLVRKLVERDVEVIIVRPDSTRLREGANELEGGGTLVSVPAGRRWTLARGLQPWRRRAKAVVERMAADLVHGQGLIPGGLVAADVTDRPTVVTARGNARQDTIAAYTGVGGMTRVYLRERLARTAIGRTDVVIGVNPDWTVNLPQRPRQFVYIPNMIEETFFIDRREAEPGRVLFAGGTRAIKGWELLANAWTRVCERVGGARLNVVGWPEGEAPPGISARHRKSLLVEGWLSSGDLADRMRRATALVIPSQFEVSPIALAEAWGIGLPVVAVPVGGIPALATGAAVLAERNPEALAAGIVAALAGGEEIEGLVEEGRRRVEAHRPDAVASAHLSLYQSLLAK
jgi:glycosyltransferase involved in cell wall biosynthesis